MQTPRKVSPLHMYSSEHFVKHVLNLAIILEMLQMLQSMRGNYFPYPYIYPQPAQMAGLIQPVAKQIHSAKIWHEYQQADYRPVAHPSFLEGMDTEHMFKIFKFGTWAQRMVESGNITLSDIIKAELQIFDDMGFALRADFQVGTIHHIIVKNVS